MPNGVTYSDEKTIVKAMTAIAGQGDLDFPATLACVARLQEAGILFREEAESTPRGPRGSRTAAQEMLDAGKVSSEVFGGDVETARTSDDPQSIA